MITIDGKYTEANVFTDELEDLARTQIRDVCNHSAFEGSRVRIMPDVHAGAGCVIGFTAELKTDKVIPNLIGVDIGCGVLTADWPACRISSGLTRGCANASRPACTPVPPSTRPCWRIRSWMKKFPASAWTC